MVAFGLGLHSDRTVQHSRQHSCGADDEHVGSIRAAQKVFKTGAMFLVRSSDAQIHNVHSIGERPFESLHQSVDIGRESPVEDPNGIDIRLRRFFMNHCGNGRSMSESIHKIRTFDSFVEKDTALHLRNVWIACPTLSVPGISRSSTMRISRNSAVVGAKEPMPSVSKKFVKRPTPV